MTIKTESAIIKRILTFIRDNVVFWFNVHGGP